MQGSGLWKVSVRFYHLVCVDGELGSLAIVKSGSNVHYAFAPPAKSIVLNRGETPRSANDLRKSRIVNGELVCMRRSVGGGEFFGRVDSCLGLGSVDR